tara:strand:+ start:1421 stop:2191 length:771 start_codon:yes stop_codon:yes gene_type:complete
MSWYHKDWTQRAPILIDNFNGASQIDVTAAVPSDFPRFWENVDAANSGADIRVTLADGRTLATFDVDGFNSTTKTATIEIDGFAASSADAGLVAWLYWGATGKSSATTTFTPSSAKTGHISVAVPGSGTQRMVRCAPEAPGAAQPRTEIFKASGETIHVWWDLTGVLGLRAIPDQGKRFLDEVEHVSYEVTAQGNPQSAMIDEGETRMAGSGFIRTTIKAGSSGTNYLARLLVTLTSGRILDFRCTIRVKDVQEPT